MDAPKLKPLLTYEEAGRLLNLPIGTLYAWVSQRRIPHVRLSGRVVRFDEDELGRWLAERRVGRRGRERAGHDEAVGS